jgi:hypothetical protein
LKVHTIRHPKIPVCKIPRGWFRYLAHGLYCYMCESQSPFPLSHSEYLCVLTLILSRFSPIPGAHYEHVVGANTGCMKQIKLMSEQLLSVPATLINVRGVWTLTRHLAPETIQLHSVIHEPARDFVFTCKQAQTASSITRNIAYLSEKRSLLYNLNLRIVRYNSYQYDIHYLRIKPGNLLLLNTS